jgi:ferrous iron transport protein B
MSREEILQAKDRSITHLRRIFGDDAETVIATERYGFISGLLKETLKKPAIERLTVSDKIDKVVINRWLGIPIFLALMYGVFQFTFVLSAPLMDWIDAGFGWLAEQVSGIGGWFGSFLADGVIGGVGSVLVFIPPIFLLFIALAILEDSGYLARAAFVMDRVMHKIGLHGRSFIPMLLGFGCNIPAIMATRTIENPKDRLTTILINPLMSCGARLPIYILLAAAFFSAYQGLVVFSMYAIGIVLAIIMALVFRRWLLPGPSGHFIMELPPYRLPTIIGVLVHMWERGRLFLFRAGTIIFGVVVLIWFLSSMPWGVEYGSAQSWLGAIGGFFAPIFSPLGFGQWQASVALIFGFLAKEVVVGTFGTLFSVGEEALGATIMTELGWTPLVAYAFMAFCLLYVPCVATVAVIRRETNSWKWTGFAVGYTIVLAWIVATLIYQVGGLLGLG